LAATCRLQNGGFHGCKTYQYKENRIGLYNNSPDTLRKSILPSFLIMLSNQEEMDARIQSIKDPDGRMVSK
jgi:hypothetical protein